eukprot:1134602-Pelagomonas_calceolata.AAC.7
MLHIPREDKTRAGYYQLKNSFDLSRKADVKSHKIPVAGSEQHSGLICTRDAGNIEIVKKLRSRVGEVISERHQKTSYPNEEWQAGGHHLPEETPATSAELPSASAEAPCCRACAMVCSSAGEGGLSTSDSLARACTGRHVHEANG